MTSAAILTAIMLTIVSYLSSQTNQQREATAQRLAKNSRIQQNTLTQQSASQELSTKASFLLAFKLAKANKPFSNGEFFKQCMVEKAGLLCLNSKSKYEQANLSRRIVTYRVEINDEHLASDMKSKADSIVFYSLALDESIDRKDTAQLLIFVRGIRPNDNFKIVELFWRSNR